MLGALAATGAARSLGVFFWGCQSEGKRVLTFARWTWEIPPVAKSNARRKRKLAQARQTVLAPRLYFLFAGVFARARRPATPRLKGNQGRLSAVDGLGDPDDGNQTEVFRRGRAETRT